MTPIQHQIFNSLLAIILVIAAVAVNYRKGDIDYKSHDGQNP